MIMITRIAIIIIPIPTTTPRSGELTPSAASSAARSLRGADGMELLYKKVTKWSKKYKRKMKLAEAELKTYR